MPKRWSEFPLSPRGLPLAAMRACFTHHFARAVAFREDGALAERLADEAEPVLAALHVALSARDPRPALHEPYALATLLARRAAMLGATPSAALTLAGALAQALGEAGDVVLDAEQPRALAIVCVEGYCAARDERVTSELLNQVASAQVAVPLGPGCLAIFLAGPQDERALERTLEALARRLLHEGTLSCLLDVTRLAQRDAPDDALARVVANFCAMAAALGVHVTLVGGSAALQARFARWLGERVQPEYHDDFCEAQARALAQAGLVVKARWPWPRLRMSSGRRPAG